MKRQLYYGDNLPVLREHIADETVDLIYLDPPFNSQRPYNLLFKSPTGHESDAQITAFEDTWHWGPQAEREFNELLQQPNTHVAEMMRAFRAFLGENDVMAYLTMMAGRLLELCRVLKPTGSLYLHCDPTASHYLKIVLDGVFGKERYRNEIIWQRTNAHNTARGYGRIHDTIFFYTRTESFVWNDIRTDVSEEQLSRYKKDSEGRLYRTQDLTASRPNSDSGKFEWRDVLPPSTRGWGYTLKQLEEWWEEGRILTRADGKPRMDGLKVYLGEQQGKRLQSVWTDIPRIPNTSSERLPYPTQKPLALLERIIQASSNEGDLVLDPFCGCGTAVHAAEKLKRRWIGIDITHLAISLIEKRLRDAFPNIAFEVIGAPEDYEGAVDLAKRDKYQFQWWACSLVDAQPYQGKKKGADRGIDGLIFFRDDNQPPKKIVVSVKGGEHVGVHMVREFETVRKREKAELGLFVTLAEPTQPMIAEAAAAGFYHSKAYNQDWPRIQILTVRGLLDRGESPQYINVDTGVGFKRARRETTAHRGNVEMDWEG
jgi:DNA modification methylase